VIFSTNQQPGDGESYWDGSQMLAALAKGGGLAWFRNGQCHRDNHLPAMIFADGGKWWFRNGKIEF